MNYEMAYLIGTLRERLLKQKIMVNGEQSIFLFIRNNLMTKFK
jgi:hypothetical protein